MQNVKFMSCGISMRFDLFLTSLSLFIAKFKKLWNRVQTRISRSGLKSYDQWQRRKLKIMSTLKVTSLNVNTP